MTPDQRTQKPGFALAAAPRARRPMRSPKRDSRAGSTVSAASIVISTASADATARP